MKAITREHVDLALAEARDIGREAFLDRYGYAMARRYLLVEEGGRAFDSKAVVGVAYGHAHPDSGPLAPRDFSGGVRGAVRILHGLGYTVVDRVRTAWSFLMVDEPQHAGNLPYGDEAGQSYVWDSTVANHGKPQAGDLAVVRSGSEVLGSGWIERVITGKGEKQRRRCPECSTTDFKARISKSPRYRCGDSQHHEFEHPVIDVIDVSIYRAQFSRTWEPAGITVEEFEASIGSRARQHSIREADLGRVLELLRRDSTIPLRRVEATARRHSDSVGRSRSSGRNAPSLSDIERTRIGDLGERMVLDLERETLRSLGRPDLSRRVEWVAQTGGPDAGFDILSFDASGRERHIEVKSTLGGESTAFFITRNELAFGSAHPDSYEIHRGFLLETDPQVVVYPGDPRETLELEAVTYRARART